MVYEYIGYNYVSILYDRNKVNVEIMSYKIVLNFFEEMKRKNKILIEFNLLVRMSMCKIESILWGEVYFICVFWYGLYKKLKIRWVEELKNLFKFIVVIGMKEKMFFIIVGDFNIYYNFVEEEIDKYDGIKIYEFKFLLWRVSNFVDYFIILFNLILSNIVVIDWEILENGKGVEKLFDYDFVVSLLLLYDLKFE